MPSENLLSKVLDLRVITLWMKFTNIELQNLRISVNYLGMQVTEYDEAVVLGTISEQFDPQASTSLDELCRQSEEKLVLVEVTDVAVPVVSPELLRRGFQNIYATNDRSLYILPPAFGQLTSLKFWSLEETELNGEFIHAIKNFLGQVKMLGANIREVSYGSKDFEKLFALRYKVFVEEQKVPEEDELDEFESCCVHLSYTDRKSGAVIGVCRVRPLQPFRKIERVAVDEKYRTLGIGRRLNEAAIKLCRTRFPDDLIVLHAQVPVLEFYAKLGMIWASEEFDECGIMHRTLFFPPVFSHIERLSVRIRTLFEEHKSYIAGEIFDPEVVKNILRILKEIRNVKFVPLVALQHSLPHQLIGGGVMKQLGRILYACQQFSMENADCRKHITQEILDWEVELIDFAWDKLNTGEEWRQLYALLMLTKSVRLHTNGKKKDAIEAADMGLIMGGVSLDGVLPAWAELRARELMQDEDDLSEMVSIKCPTIVDPVPRSLPWSGNVKEVHVSELDPYVFLSEFLLTGVPVVIRGLTESWPASKNWSLESFVRRLWNRKFPVEKGSKYTDDDWSQQLMTGKQMFQLMDQNGWHREPYLAQHRLLDQIPALKNDVILPEYCTVAGTDSTDVDMNIWLGPKGTVSPLHTDPRQNLFCQVVGTKWVRLVHRDDSDKVYAIEDGILTNTSQMDVINPDLSKYPLFEDAVVVDALVKAGDALFIPQLWWHHVTSLEFSISLSLWFDKE